MSTAKPSLWLKARLPSQFAGADPGKPVEGRRLSRRRFSIRLLQGAATLAAAPSLIPGVWGEARSSALQFPAFKWDRVPLYAHVGKSADDFSEEELHFLADHYDFITIEKGQAVEKRGSTEEGIYEAARQLKKLNPRMTVLFYWNTFVDYPGYQSRERVRPGWHLRDSRGRMVLKGGRIPFYDLSIPELREWWAEVAATAMRAAPLDGIFADALVQVLSPGRDQHLGQDRADALRQGLESLMKLTRQKLGPDKLILANALRGGQGLECLDWGVSGLKIEHFGQFRSGDKETMEADINSMDAVAGKGKLVVFKGWPDFFWLDNKMMEKPRQELHELAAQRITFPLACFLVGARSHCHFCYSWGYREAHGAFDWYPEFDKALGAPRGVAVKERWIWSREFKHAAVRVDLEKKTAAIRWR